MNDTIHDTRSKFMSVVRYISGNTRNYYVAREWDTCSLWRHILFVFLIVLPFKLTIYTLTILIISAMFVIAGKGVIDSFNVGGSDWWWYPIYMLTTCVIGILTVVVGLCIGAFISWSDEKRSAVAHANAHKEPTLLVSLYRSWKGKFCSKVRFM